MKTREFLQMFPDAFIPPRKNISDFLVIFINFSFYFLCCPFRLITVKDEVTLAEYFIVKTWSLQKFLCGIFTVNNILWMVYWIRGCMPTAKNPAFYVEMFKVVISQLHKFATIKKFWLNKDDFLKITNFLNSDEINYRYQTEDKFMRWKIGVILLCIFYTSVALLNWVGHTGLIRSTDLSKASQFDFDIWWKQMIIGGRKIFFRDFRTNDTSVTSNDHISGLDIFCGVLAAMGLYQR